MRRQASDLQGGAGSRSGSFFPTGEGAPRARTESPAELAYARERSWHDDSFGEDYGMLVDGHDHHDHRVGTEVLTERDGSDSDSSIDLHTPLP